MTRTTRSATPSAGGSRWQSSNRTSAVRREDGSSTVFSPAGRASMRDMELTIPEDDASHLTWVRTRLSLDKDFLEAIRYGFSLIVAGFGSYSLFEGLTIGDREVA